MQFWIFACLWNLEFYDKLKQVKGEFIDRIINALIREMRLQKFTKKISGRLSGRNKRKYL